MTTLTKSTKRLAGSGKNVKLPVDDTKALTPGCVIGESGSLNGSKGSVYSKRKVAVGGLCSPHSQPLSISDKHQSKPWGKRMPDGRILSWASIKREQICQELEDEGEDFANGIDDYEN